MVFERLAAAGLKLKPEKCAFFQRSVAFLGHIISEDGVSTDPAKTKAVTSWPTPTSVTEVRSFTGLCSYYRRFVKDFAKIAAPLHELTRKNIRFQWTPAAQESFERLKEALTTPPILAMPDDEGEFCLDTDASEKSIGAVLSQRQNGLERVIAYASRSLDAREINYCISRKELLAVVHFIKHFKQYLLGRRFRIRTDHVALTWLKKTPYPIGQQARWLEQMEEFEFEIEHRAGTKHGNADALSRRPCTKKGCFCHGPGSYHPGQDNGLTAAAVHCDARTDPASMTPKSSEPRESEDDSEVSGNERATPVAQPQRVDQTTSQQPVEDWSLGRLKEAQLNDPDVSVIYQLIASETGKPVWDDVSPYSNDVKQLWTFWERLAIRGGLLCRRFEVTSTGEVHWQAVIPKSLRREFIETVHAGCGHLGTKKTAAAVQARAYWPSWSADVVACLKKCHQCTRYHRGKPPRQAELQTPRVGEPWERISIDITGPHPRSSRGNIYILTIVDHFSKWAEALPIPNHTAVTVAKMLVTHVLSRFGAPVQLLSDQGAEFESELFAELMRWMEVDKLRTSPYKPSTNGTVERFHRTLNAMLAKVIDETQKDWDDHLAFVLMAYRATKHDSTGFSPNKLFLGRENRSPVDVVMGLPTEESREDGTYDDYVCHQQELADRSFTLARQHLGRCAERRKVPYDARVKKAEFKKGIWVWYLNQRRYQKRSPKWQSCYTGPYLIIGMIPPVNCVLQRSARSKPFVVHIDKVKKVVGETPQSWLIEQEDTKSVPSSNEDCVGADARSTDQMAGANPVNEGTPPPTPRAGTRKTPPARRLHTEHNTPADQVGVSVDGGDALGATGQERGAGVGNLNPNAPSFDLSLIHI